jgi:hypothetical protein
LIEPRTLSEVIAALQDLDKRLSARKKPQAAYLVEGWDDLRVPGLSVERGASAPGLGAWLGAGGLEVLRFDGVNTLEQVFFTTSVSPHVHWGPVTDAAGDVIWNLEYSWAAVETVFPAVTIIQSTDAAAGAAWTHQYAPFAAIEPPTTLDLTGRSSMMVCRLYRDPNLAGDTYGADAGFLEFDLHYRMNTIGSRAELVK